MQLRGRDPYAPSKPSAGRRKGTNGRAAAAAAAAAGSGGSSKRKTGATGYNLFVREHRASADAASSAAAPGAALRAAAAAWRALPLDAREVFNARARELQADSNGGGSSSSSSNSRVQDAQTRTAAAGRKVAERGQTTSTRGRATSARRSTRAVAADDDATSSVDSGSSSSGGGGGRRRSRTVSARPLSGWQLFCRQQRPLLAAEQPGAPPSALLAALGAGWRSLSDAQRSQWGVQPTASDNSAGTEDSSPS